MLQFAHDLRQHGVRRGGPQDNQQLFTQVLEKRQHAQAGQAHHQAQDQRYERDTGQVEQADQAAKVLQGIQAILAGGEGYRAEHANRRQAHDHAHDAEDHMTEFVDQPRDAGRRLTHQVQRTAEQH
ncbi:hypothetical protein D3C78_1351510 [compost metagenome]